MLFKQRLDNRVLETRGNSARDKACVFNDQNAWTDGFNGVFDDLRGDSIIGGCRGIHVLDNISQIIKGHW